MLAVVKEPHIELSINGAANDVDALMEIIRDRYEVTVLVDNGDAVKDEDDGEEVVNIRDTDFWRERVSSGVLLQGYRLKHGMTQRRLAKASGISYATISEYEHDRRKITPLAAHRLAVALDEDEATFFDRLQP